MIGICDWEDRVSWRARIDSARRGLTSYTGAHLVVVLCAGLALAYRLPALLAYAASCT